MNALASQCSSGCESGWTLYLEHSFQLNHNASSHTTSQLFKDKQTKKLEEAEEEDLSMVSDASSGPPHLHLPDAQDNGSFYSASKAAKLGKKSKKRQKVKENQHLPSLLDDTASSPVFDFSMVTFTFLALPYLLFLVLKKSPLVVLVMRYIDDTHLALDNFSEQFHCDQTTNFRREHARLLTRLLCYLL